MKKTLAILAALVGGGLAFAAEPSSSYSVTADFPYVTDYVFRGQKICRDAFQPSIELTIGDFYGGVWGNVPMSNPKKNTENSSETDVYVGYNLKVSDMLKLDFGGTYYYYPRHHVETKSSTEGYIGANFTSGGFTPAIYAYWDFKLHAFSAQASVGYSFPMPNLGASLDVTASLGRVRPDIEETYWYSSIGVSVPFKVSETVKINVGVSYTVNDSTKMRDPGLWATAGVTLAF